MARAVDADVQELRRFGLLLGALLAAIFGGIPLLRHHSTPVWPWVIGAVLWLGALLAPTALGYLHRGWARLSGALGWINTRVILSLLYAIAVVPIGLVMRLVGRDPMVRKFDPTLESYRIPSKQRSPSHLERPF